VSPGPRLEVVAAVLCRDGRLLAARRPPGKARAGCFELPGGKIEPGESPEQALRRELREELDLEVQVGELFRSVDHDYPDLQLRLHAYHCSVEGAGEPEPREHVELRWLAPDELLDVPWSGADRRLVEALARSR
jgi:8-oxo-dGTP diphosphatase